MRRYRRSNPAAGRGPRSYTAAQVVDYATATGTGYSAQRIHPPNDVIAILGSLAALIATYGGLDDPGFVALLGVYGVTANRTAHGRSSGGDAAAHLNSIALMIAADPSTRSVADYDRRWSGIGRSLLSNIQSWPNDLAAQVYRAVRSIVDQVTIAQMPGYQWGPTMTAPLPPQPSHLVPQGGGGAGPSSSGIVSMGHAGAGGPSTVEQWALDVAAQKSAEAGAVIGSLLLATEGPVGVVAGELVGERLGELLEQWAVAHGGRTDIPSVELSSAVRRAADEALAAARSQSGQIQLNLDSVRSGGGQSGAPVTVARADGSFGPRPNDTGGGTIAAGPVQGLVPSGFGGGQLGVGSQIGGIAGTVLGGVLSAYTGGAVSPSLGADLGAAAGQGVQGGVGAIDEEV